MARLRWEDVEHFCSELLEHVRATRSSTLTSYAAAMASAHKQERPSGDAGGTNVECRN